MPKETKARITISIDITLDPDLYDDGATPQEMLAVEIANAEADPTEYFTFFEGNSIPVSVSGKLIQAERST